MVNLLDEALREIYKERMVFYPVLFENSIQLLGKYTRKEWVVIL